MTVLRKKYIFLLILIGLFPVLSFTKDKSNTDIIYYHLSIQVQPNNRSISGINQIDFKTLASTDSVEFNLDTALEIDSVTSTVSFQYKRVANKLFIYFTKPAVKNQQCSFLIYYHGSPRTAPHAPWEGGFVWTKDSLNNDWVGVACEAEGGSLWWPCKEDPADEPDSMKLSVTCPAQLFCVSNGNLIQIENKDSLRTFHWKIHYPVNNYNVTLNIGNYIHFSDTLFRSDGSRLPLDYYVLSYNLSKAQHHFQQVPKILSAYEKFFGPYPFPKDGYALVETSYWGMEHQSAISYGNKYRNNMGPYDFIIAHETAHEWWGNNITAKNMGHLWIHEAFATYAEALLIENQLGEITAREYLDRQKLKIKNENPLVSQSTDMHPEDTDIYYKGTWMLHTLRHCINNDAKWFKAILELAEQNHCQILSTEDVIKFLSSHLSKKLTPVFSHYLYSVTVPELHYSFKRTQRSRLIFQYHWEKVDKKFKMPFIIEINGKKTLLMSKTKKRHFNLGVVNESIVRIQTQLQYIETVQDGQ